jgi:hypothetical protein
LKILILDENKKPTNTTTNVVYKEVFRNVWQVLAQLYPPYSLYYTTLRNILTKIFTISAECVESNLPVVFKDTLWNFCTIEAYQ